MLSQAVSTTHSLILTFLLQGSLNTGLQNLLHCFRLTELQCCSAKRIKIKSTVFTIDDQEKSL